MADDTTSFSRGAARREEIFDVTERFARRNGYNGFSFRDISSKIGIKSASLYYHFPTKADLVSLLVERYTQRFIAELGSPSEPGAPHRLIAAYRGAVEGPDRMCLCGVLGAELHVLPEPVRDAVRGFFEAVVAWASESLGEENGSRAGAETLVSGLEGALILARSMRDPALYDRAAAQLLDLASGRPRQVVGTP